MTTDARKLCVMCAWRGTCRLKYSMPGGVAAHCVEYTRDITLREPEEEIRKRNVLLIGPKEIGKTTLIRRLLERVSQANLHVRGYYTQWTKEGFFGSGTELVLLNGDGRGAPAQPTPAQRTLTLTSSRSKPGWSRLGRQFVNLDDVHDRLVPEIRSWLQAKDVDLIVLDEIGKAECLSQGFRQAVVDGITSPKSMLATVSVGEGDDDFLRDLGSRADVTVLHIGYDNRDRLLDRVLSLLTGENITRLT